MWAFTWPFRIVVIAVSLVGMGTMLFALGAMSWRVLGHGRRIDINEEAKKFWGDVDEAAAFIRSALYVFLGGLNISVGGLLVGIYGRAGLSEIDWYVEFFLFSTLALIVLWWLERELAWPGLLVVPEIRGTRGLFFVRRERRRRARGEDRASGERDPGAEA
ncbi:hypothetical protein [Promicromonospora aerolata]|uniref:DUF3784 domain-containing protein n=1 Tax=Promicromonospora aerolata TaxID=195749 RepID=A0ABW4V761_9MICO